MESSSFQEKYIFLKRQKDDLELMYKSIKEKYSELLDQNTELLRRNENMSDYGILKEELASKSKEFLKLQHGIEEIRRNASRETQNLTDSVKDLEHSLKNKELQVKELKKQLCSTQDALLTGEQFWIKEREKLESESYSSKEQYQSLMQRINEQKEDIQDLHCSVHLLHNKVTSHDSKSPSKSRECSPIKIAQRIAESTRRFNKHQTSSREKSPGFSPKYKSSLEFIGEAKNQINRFKNENALQERYSLLYPNVTKPELGSFFFSRYPNHEPNRSDFTHLRSAGELPSLGPDSQLDTLVRNSFYICNPVSDQLPSSQSFLPSSSYVATEAVHSLNKDRSLDLVNSGLQSTSVRGTLISGSAETTNLLAHSVEAEAVHSLNKNRSLDLVNSGLQPTSLRGTLISGSDETTNLPAHSVATGHLLNVINEEALTLGLKDPSLLANVEAAFSDSNSKVSSGQNIGVLEGKTQVTLSSMNEDIERQDNTKERYVKYLENTSLLHTEESLKDAPATESMNRRSSSNILNAHVSLSESDKERKNLTPVTVDLDAVWRRKSSLAPLDVYSGANITSSHETQGGSENGDAIVSQTDHDDGSKEETVDGFNNHIAQEDGLGNLKDPSIDMRHHSDKQESLFVTERNKTSAEDVNDTLETATERVPTLTVADDSRKTIGEIATEQVPTLSIADDSRKSIGDNSNILSNEEKQSDNSASEISEVHLSCGSEQEQEKEQSDDW